MPNMNRRSIITGLIGLVAAPAIIRASSLMPVKTMLPDQIRMLDGADIFQVTGGSVRLPPPAIGQIITILNSGSSPLNVFSGAAQDVVEAKNATEYICRRDGWLRYLPAA